MHVRPRGNRFELKVQHKMLPKTFYASFPTEAEARDYGARLEALLDRGILVDGLIAERSADPTLSGLIASYRTGALPPARDAILAVLADELKGVTLSAVTYRWCEAWVTQMKRERRLAPGTIRKRVSALSHALEAHHRRLEQAWANPLRLLPRGYASYSREDAAQLAERDLAPRRDIQRDRRLGADEEARIRAALAGEKRPDRERALEHDPAFTMLFDLILDTGMRLREAYTLRTDQTDLASGTINVAGTKGKDGALRPRQVPIKPALRLLLSDYCRDRVGLMFPFWNGDRADLARVTAALSRRFARLFDYAGVADFTEHDLRHEACCRWVTLRNSRGGWMFSDLETCRIMGWSDPRMMLRYASLRGTDLAARFSE